MDAIARALTVLAVIVPLLIWSGLRLWRTPRLATAVQAIGALALLVVVVAHVCEALRVFPRAGWGQPHSIGHYVDLSSAILGLALVPLGYVLGRRADDKTARAPL